MAQQSASANGVRIALWSVVEEIDDDDEDVLEVTIEIHNQSAQDLWDLNGNIRDMDGTTALARSNPLELKQVQVIGCHFGFHQIPQHGCSPSPTIPIPVRAILNWVRSPMTCASKRNQSLREPNKRKSQHRL